MSLPITEEWARNMLLFAISKGQAAELLYNLWEGGTFTLDVDNNRLVFLTADMMEAARGNSGN